MTAGYKRLQGLPVSGYRRIQGVREGDKRLEDPY